MPEALSGLPAWAWYLAAGVVVAFVLRRLTVERAAAGRGGRFAGRAAGKTREEEWPEIAEGIIRICRRDPAFKDELGAPLALSATGQEILEQSGLKAMVDGRMPGLAATVKARGAENDEDVLKWGLAAFFETDPGPEFRPVRDFIGFKRHYKGSKLDLQLVGVIAAVYFRDRFLAS